MILIQRNITMKNLSVGNKYEQVIEDHFRVLF